jgi:putative acetyltransferase
MIEIREERPGDVEAIREVNREAFAQAQEAELVEKLRENCRELLSLVAIVEGQVAGHILFSPATIEGESKTLPGMALGPMAVLSEYQGRGVGSALIREGIAGLRRILCPFVIVLGHATYYPKFGFEPASRRHVRCEWEVPDEVFMILVLDEGKVKGVEGVARYRPEFSEAL